MNGFTYLTDGLTDVAQIETKYAIPATDNGKYITPCFSRALWGSYTEMKVTLELIPSSCP